MPASHRLSEKMAPIGKSLIAIHVGANQLVSCVQQPAVSAWRGYLWQRKLQYKERTLVLSTGVYWLGEVCPPLSIPLSEASPQLQNTMIAIIILVWLLAVRSLSWVVVETSIVPCAR